MAEAILDIKHWGHSLGVRLPAAVARDTHLHVDPLFTCHDGI